MCTHCKKWLPCRDITACQGSHNQYYISCGFRSIPRECLYARASISSLIIGPDYQYRKYSVHVAIVFLVTSLNIFWDHGRSVLVAVLLR